MDIQATGGPGRKVWVATVCGGRSSLNKPSRIELLQQSYLPQALSFTVFHSNSHKHKGMPTFPLLGGSCSHWDKNKDESYPWIRKHHLLSFIKGRQQVHWAQEIRTPGFTANLYPSKEPPPLKVSSRGKRGEEVQKGRCLQTP